MASVVWAKQWHIEYSLCSALAASSADMQGGGKNPFAALGNMGNIMENVKKAQQLVQVEAAKAQEELAA